MRMRWMLVAAMAWITAAAWAATPEDEGAARAAWARKLQDFQQCKAGQRAPSYGPAASGVAAKKPAPCVDPGPFVPPRAASAPTQG
ncbi:hypothetical protein ASE08_24290 [Rhizobacter sp. Root16D2]|nr:hypothetical protein ASC88_27680 [Rhizobacter sp. Root29]KQW11261.1 hypothetical protein ASC98_21980 [Rhizobacter sp. Root1238]KRB18206.1 hypothetical protein ASE08_24290 [Rhizobacter sp. Root16D2]